MKNWHMSLFMSIASVIALLILGDGAFGLGFIIFMSTTYVCRSIEANTEVTKKEIERGTNVIK